MILFISIIFFFYTLLFIECLEECACLIEMFGISVCQPSPAHAMKLIAQQISDRDNGVRNAALNTMITAYMIINDKLFNLTGPVSFFFAFFSFFPKFAEVG